MISYDVKIFFLKNWIIVYLSSNHSVHFVISYLSFILNISFNHARFHFFSFVIYRNIINDCFYTTIPLLVPPHEIALTSIYMICIYSNIDPTEAFSSLNVNMKIVYSVCAQMCSFYETSIDFWPSSLTDTIILLSQQFQS